MSIFRLTAVVFALAGLCSCGHVHLGMRSMSRQPIASAIILDHSLHVPPNKKVHQEFFPGEYKPVGQDSEGTYYQSQKPVRLHDITEFLSKDCIAGFYLRDDGTGGLHMWARNGELVGHGPIVRPGTPQPPVMIVRNPAFKYVDPDADDEAAEEAQKLKPEDKARY